MRAKQGDVVRLKSGGPIMTVGIKASSNDDKYQCDWFENLADRCNVHRSMIFHLDQLEVIETKNK